MDIRDKEEDDFGIANSPFPPHFLLLFIRKVLQLLGFVVLDCIETENWWWHCWKVKFLFLL